MSEQELDKLVDTLTAEQLRAFAKIGILRSCQILKHILQGV